MMRYFFTIVLPFRVGIAQSNPKGVVVDEFGNAIENAYRKYQFGNTCAYE
jgi:hypothetical protein